MAYALAKGLERGHSNPRRAGRPGNDQLNKTQPLSDSEAGAQRNESMHRLVDGYKENHLPRWHAEVWRAI